MTTTRMFQALDPVRWLLAALLGLGLAACGGDGDDVQQTTTLRATLTGDQEVPPVVTGAIGSGTLSLEVPSLKVAGSITVDGITANAAHVHLGEVGVSGPIIVPLAETTPGTWTVPAGTTLTRQQADAFFDGRLYFNAHTTAHPDGEIRGQIGRDVFNVAMLPAQEVPPPASTATGTGMLVVDPETRKLSARLTVSGMTPTAAHIHTGAAGFNGPIIFPLSETVAGSGIWVSATDARLTEAQLAMLRAGELYFNAHSTAFPNGEVRGQIGRHVAFASLSGQQEVPPTSSTATGSGTLAIDPATRAASGRIALSGMTTTAAHIHLAAPGVNGPIIVPLTSVGSEVWVVPAETRLSAEQFLAFKQGHLYYNAHSMPFPNGEIRGQIR